MFGGHNVIRAAISFAGNHGHLGNSRLAICEKKLGTVLNYAAVFLRCSGQEPRHIDNRQDRNLKRITEAYKPCGLSASVNVQAPRQHHWLVSDDANSGAFKPDKPCQYILGKVFLNFKEIPFVRQFANKFMHVVSCIGAVRDQRIKAVFNP